ncbi:hypothetical protein PIB30_054920 [Stylosanthes scabra]|uniref:Uncharacterized protein n=1 Tax=Stylosanthes scabra TaxID=79078 RepID=A0ABU6VHU6_9FABA|nr:hypothetical protein [Stylosanthes scabra]
MRVSDALASFGKQGKKNSNKASTKKHKKKPSQVGRVTLEANRVKRVVSKIKMAVSNFKLTVSHMKMTGSSMKHRVLLDQFCVPRQRTRHGPIFVAKGTAVACQTLNVPRQA